MRSIRASTISAWVAHALTWAPGILFASGALSRSESVAAVAPGEPGNEPTRIGSTLFAEIELYVVLWLLVPVLLTVIVLLALRISDNGQAIRKILLWSPGVLLLGFSFVAIASIGMLYMPAAFALLAAAFADHHRLSRSGKQ